MGKHPRPLTVADTESNTQAVYLMLNESLSFQTVMTGQSILTLDGRIRRSGGVTLSI